MILYIFINFLNMNSYLSQKFSGHLIQSLNLCLGRASVRVRNVRNGQTRVFIYVYLVCLSGIITKLEQLQRSPIYSMKQFGSATEELYIYLSLKSSVFYNRTYFKNFTCTENKAALILESDLISKSILIYKAANLLSVFYRTCH